MKADIVAQLRELRGRGSMRQEDVPQKPDPDHIYQPPPRRVGYGTNQRDEVQPGRPGFLHKDSGIVFPSRSALKKAIRIVWERPSPLRAKNQVRFDRVLRGIVRANDLDLPAMVKAEITKLIAARVPDMSPSDIQNQFAAYIRNEVKEALKGKNLGSLIREIVQEETKRLVLESLHVDFSIAGNAYTRPPGTGRAVRLADAETD